MSRRVRVGIVVFVAGLAAATGLVISVAAASSYSLATDGTIISEN
jgi:hypothetical protein